MIRASPTPYSVVPQRPAPARSGNGLHQAVKACQRHGHRCGKRLLVLDMQHIPATHCMKLHEVENSTFFTVYD
jgi:hypothetical protein